MKQERERLKTQQDRQLNRSQIRDIRSESLDEAFELLIQEDMKLRQQKGSSSIAPGNDNALQEKSIDALKKKAEKSGMPLGILKKVYDRGIAAWRTGHRPGTTPQQWGFARVNSFITKSSGTWGKADADLAAKVRKEEVEEGAVSPAQRAAIAISKKAKAGKPGYDSEGKALKEDCWSGYKQVGMKKKNGKDVPNCVPEEENDPAIEKQKDGSYSYKRQVIKEEIDVLFEGFMANKVKSVSINKKMYDHALKTLKDVLTRKQKEAKAKKTGMRHSSEYYAAQIARTYKDVDGKVLHKMLGEEHIFEAGGAGDRGTDKLTKRYKKDTPGESVSESIDELFEAQFKVEVEGLPDMFIDAKSAGDVKATLRKKLKKPDDVQSIERVTPDKIKKHFRMVVRGDQDPTSINEDVTQKQLNDLEKFADRLLDKFGVDVEFTRHFADRMNDDRNKPKITIPELQRFFKKVAKNKAKDIKQLGDSEAVLKDIQADLNLPVVINYDKNKEEFEVVNKTIMRKKDFKTPDKVVKY